MFHGLNSIFHPLLSDTHYYLPSHPGMNFQLCLANPRALDSLARIYVGIYLLCPCHVLLHMATHPAVKVLDTYLMNKQYARTPLAFLTLKKYLSIGTYAGG